MAELAASSESPVAAGAPLNDQSLHEHRHLRRHRYFRAMWSGAISRGVSMVCQFFAIALTVRYLGAERYGMWGQLSAWVAWLALANFGLGLGLTTRLSNLQTSKDATVAGRAISSSLVIICVVSAGLALLTLFVAPLLPWARFFNVTSALAVSEAKPTAVACLLLLVSLLPLSLGGSILNGYQRGDVAGACTTVMTLLGLVVLIIATRLHWGLTGLAVGLLLPQVLADALHFFAAARLGLLQFSWKLFDPREAWRMLWLGLRFLLLQLFAIVTFQTGATIIAQSFSSAEVTPYAVTMRLAMLVITVFNVAFTPLWPAFGEAYARGDRDWIRRIFWRALRLVFVAWIPITLVLGTIGPWLIRLWAGPAAVPSYLLLWALLACTLTNAIGLVLSYLLNGAGLLSSQLIGGSIMAVLHVPLAIYLCHRFGIAGVALSQTILMALIALPVAWIQVMQLLSHPLPPADKSELIPAGGQ